MRSLLAFAILLAVSGCASVPGPKPTAPATAPAIAPPADGFALGTASPTTVTTASPDGRWVVACQARRDTNGDGVVQVYLSQHGGPSPSRDELQPYLFLGERTEGEPIDDYVDRSPDGRYLAVIAGGRLWVIDAHTGDRLDLSAGGAVLADDHDPFQLHRAATFDLVEDRVLWFRPRPGRVIAVVRDLPTGKETVLDVGEGLPWRGWTLGSWALIRVLDRDTDGDGKITVPWKESSRAPRRCRGVEFTYSVTGQGGDRPTQYLVSLVDGRARQVPDFVSAFGEDLLVAGEGGDGLALEDREGHRTPFLAEGAIPIALDPFHGRLLVATGPEKSRTLELLGRGTRQALGPIATVPDFRTVIGTPLVALGPVLADLERATLVPLPAGTSVAYLQGRRALLQAEGKLAAFDAETGTMNPVLDGKLGLDLDWKGPIVRTGDLVIDLAGARLLGRFEGQAAALASDGRVLVPAEGWRDRPGEGRSFNEIIESEEEKIPAMGPLRWVRPVPPAARTAE